MRPIYDAARAAAKAAGRPVALTLHRAFDVCRNPFAALEAARELGLSTILTSGQAASAPAGAALLRQLVEAAGDTLEILVGAGVTPANLPALAAQTGARAFHMSGKQVLDSRMTFRREGCPHGPARLLGVRGLADQRDRHPAGPQSSGSAELIFLCMQRRCRCELQRHRLFVSSQTFRRSRLMGGSSGVGMVYLSMAWGVDSTFSPASFRIHSGCRGDAAAIGAERFQRVAQAPLAPLLAGGYTLLPAFHRAHELPLADVGGAVGGLLCLLTAKVEAGE